MNRFSEKLLTWYSKHGRELPWRGTQDPYVIWVSEIMLQQTRVDTVIPYFKHWMTVFPDVKSLASASEEQVLKCWEGLGYYSRGRNLYRTAKILVEDFGGELPKDPNRILKLPGIGWYTAGAIASIAFGMDVVTLDGNIRRVLARYFNVEKTIGFSETENELRVLAERNLPIGRAGNYNQALMDLGAIVCLPRNPRCGDCPLKQSCQAHRFGLQNIRPVRKPSIEIPHYTVVVAVIQNNGRILLAKRPSAGLLGGMWEFPGGKVEQGENLEQGLIREVRDKVDAGIKIGADFGIYRHAYTHYRITVHAYLCELMDGNAKPLEAAKIKWVSPAQLEEYPMGKVDRLIARHIK